MAKVYEKVEDIQNHSERRDENVGKVYENSVQVSVFDFGTVQSRKTGILTGILTGSIDICSTIEILLIRLNISQRNVKEARIREIYNKGVDKEV